MTDSTVKSLEINWTTVVTRADPDWQRDGRHIPQLEPGNLPPKRELITVDWVTRHPYAPRTFAYLISEEGNYLLDQDGNYLITNGYAPVESAYLVTQSGGDFLIGEDGNILTTES